MPVGSLRPPQYLMIFFNDTPVHLAVPIAPSPHCVYYEQDVLFCFALLCLKFTHRCIDEFISITRILMDLLNPSGPRTLDRHNSTLPFEKGLVLQLLESDLFGAIDHSSDLKEVSLLVNVWNATMISDEVIFVCCDWSFDETVLYQLLVCPLCAWKASYSGRLSVVRELQNMDHVRTLLLLNKEPTLSRNVLRYLAQRVVILLPPDTFKYRIRFW